MGYRKSKGRLLGDLFGKASIFTRKTGDSVKIDTDNSGVVSSSSTVANTEFQSFIANTNTLIATKVDSSSLADVATSGSYSDLTGSPIATGDSTPKVTFSQNEPASIDAIGEVWYDTNNGSWYISVDSGIVSPVGPSSIDTTNTTSWVGFNNNNDGNLTFPYNASGNITITFNTPLWLNYFKGEAGGNHHGIITRVYYEDGTDVAGPPAPQYAGGHTINSTNSLFTYGRVTKLDLFTYSGRGRSGKSTLRAAGAPIWQEVLSAFSGSYNDLTDTPTIPSTTGLATETYVDTAVSNIVNTAPTTLNTLNELAAALNDDANFATTVTTSLAGKASNSYLTSTYTSNAAFQSFVANTNAYIAASSGSGGLSNNEVDSKIDARIQVLDIGDIVGADGNSGQILYTNGDGTGYWSNNNPSVDTSSLATWSALTSTNNAIRTLISDRVQVANLNSTLADYWPSANVISYVAASAGGGGGGGGLTYSTKTSNYTASSGEGILADTSGGSFTITLPASPSEGDQVIIADSGDFFSNNNLTVDRNGSTIIGDAEDLVLNIDTSSTTLIYDGSTWQIYVQSRKAIVPEGASDSEDTVSTGKAIAMSIVFG
jgi:hypothetical protein